MDPFSITTGVIALLGTCIKVGTVLNDFYDAIANADAKINGLRGTVQGFIQVLTLMKDTLEQKEIKSSLCATGHINNHWNHLSASIKDGHETLSELRDLLEKVSRSVSVLNEPRKHARLQKAAQEIGAYQQRIQHYTDTLQLSIQTIILWNQVTVRESIDRIPPDLEELHHEVRRMGFILTRSMTELRSAVESRTGESQRQDGNQSQTHAQLRALKNLKDCIQSASMIVSDASTTLGIDQGDGGSDLGDCLPTEQGETMISYTTGRGLGPMSEDIESDDSDSETELQMDIFHALLASGKEMLQDENFNEAESHFLNCLNRTWSPGSKVSSNQMLKSKFELIKLLLETYRRQEKLEEAQSLLMDTIGLDPGLIADMLSLVETLFQKEDYPNALTCGRCALKAYRKLGPAGASGVQATLLLLIKICKAHGNQDEQRGFEAVLVQNRAALRRDSGASANRSPRQNALPGNNTTARRRSSAKLLDPGERTKPIKSQSRHKQSPELVGGGVLIKEEVVGLERFPSRRVSNTTIGTTSSGPFSDGQASPWPQSSMTTPEMADMVGLNNGAKTGMNPEAHTPQRPSLGTIPDVEGLPLPPSHFDPKPQPSSFSTGRRVQSSSASSGFGESHIEKLGEQIDRSFNVSDPLEQSPSTTTPFPFEERLRKARAEKQVHKEDLDLPRRSRLPIKNEYESETTIYSGRSKQEDEKEKLTQRRASVKTITNLRVLLGSQVGLDTSISEGAELYKKVVVVGDSKCGKSCLLTLMTKEVFPEYPPPTQYDVYPMGVKMEGKDIDLAIWELGGNDKQGFSRLLSSPKPDAFLICFSIDRPTSLAEITRWVLDVKKFGKKAPYILVGLKSDLRSDPQIIEDLMREGRYPVTAEQGEHVAGMVKAERYLECSSKSGHGVREVLEAATGLALINDRMKDWKRKKRKDDKQKKSGDGKKGIRNFFKG